MPSTATQYDPTDPQPYKPVELPQSATEPLPIPPVTLAAQPGLVGKGKGGAVATIATLGDNIIRGIMRGKAQAEQIKAMKLKKKADGLQFSYNNDAEKYLSLVKQYGDPKQLMAEKQKLEQETQTTPGHPENTARLKELNDQLNQLSQAKNASDESWKNLYGFYNETLAPPQKKGKKSSQSGSKNQPQVDPLQQAFSKDPNEKIQGVLGVMGRIGNPVDVQVQRYLSQSAQQAAAPQQAREKGEADIEFQVQKAIADEEKQTGKPLPPERKVQISQAIRQTPPPKPPAEPKVGTIGAFVTEAAKEAGVDPNNLSAESQLGLQRAWTQAKQTGKTVGHNYVYTDKDTGEIIVVPLTTTTSGGKVEVPKVTAGGAPEPATSSGAATTSTSSTKQSRGQDRRSADRRQVRDLPAPGEKPSSTLAPGAHVIGHTLAQPKAKSQQAVLDTYKKQKTLFDLLKAQTDYMNEIKADPNKASPRQDLSLVVSAVRSMNPGSVRLPAKELELEIKAGSWGDRAQRWSENASTGLLPEEQRNDLFHIVQRETTQAGQSLAKDWQEWMTNQPLPEDLKQFAETPTGDKPHPEGASDEVYATDGTTLIGHIVDGKYVALEKK